MATVILRKVTFIHYAWVIVAVAFIAFVLASGTRSSFGVYLKPLEQEFATNRAAVALVASFSILVNGIIQPVIGQLLDRYGIRRVAFFSLAIASVGILASAFATELWQLYITFGIVVAAAVGGPSTTMGTVIAARWFAKNRGLVVGILSSGHSAGQLILIPLAMKLSEVYGWRMSYVVLAMGIAVLAIPIGFILRGDPSEIGKRPFGSGEETAASMAAAAAADQANKTPLSRAIRTHGFWMLALSFFICGYTTAGLITTHLVAYTVERGFDNMTAATALGLMGAVNTAGTMISGIISDRVGRKNPLAVIYFVRGLALLFLLVVDDALKLNLYAVIFGMAYIATVPPTSALTSQLFGRLSVGAIFGVIFMSHQIGGAIASYVTGAIFDLTGSYFLGFFLGAVLCFVAAAMCFSIKEQPRRRPSLAAAARS